MPRNEPAASEPPRSPDFERRLELYRYQYIAIPLLLLIPLLAVLGVFGETTASAAIEAGGLALDVHYPDRMHAGMESEITIEVMNKSGDTAPLLEVLIDQDYLDKFVDVSFTPELSRITDDYAVVELHDVPPGETRRVSVRFHGFWAGSQQADIIANVDNTSVSTTISTFVFP